MVIKKLVLAFVLTALAIPGIVVAQDANRATVLLRSGERVAGELEDVDNGTVYVRVSLHDQRRIGVDEVAVIDFVGGASGLPETELSVARQSNDLAVLRNGESLQGNFVDIRGGEATTPGSNARMLLFRTADGREHQIDIGRVGRVYLGEFPTAIAANAAPGDPLPADTVRVSGDQQWVATPLTVRKGDRVVFNASGQIQLSSDPDDVAQPAGSLKQRYADDAPLERNFAGALIAKVGNSEPFPIGNTTTPVTMPADGQLYLGVNDDFLSDNRGEFIVEVHRQQR